MPFLLCFFSDHIRQRPQRQKIAVFSETRNASPANGGDNRGMPELLPRVDIEQGAYFIIDARYFEHTERQVTDPLCKVILQKEL